MKSSTSVQLNRKYVSRYGVAAEKRLDGKSLVAQLSGPKVAGKARVHNVYTCGRQSNDAKHNPEPRESKSRRRFHSRCRQRSLYNGRRGHRYALVRWAESNHIKRKANSGLMQEGTPKRH